MATRSLCGIPQEALMELLTCPLCFERYDDSTRAAKFLSCLHGYCVLCLGRLAEGKQVFECPICRRDTNVPAAGVHGFSDNFIASKLKDLEHMLHVDVRRPHGLRCGSCKDGDVAVGFCSDADCMTFLCENCKITHGKLRRFDGHVVFSMEQLQQQPDFPLLRQKLHCEQHKDHRLTLFCDEEGCQKALCLVCSATGHKNHGVIDLDQKSSEVRNELQSLAEVARNKTAPVKDISGRINTEINRISTLFDERLAEISAFFDDLQAQLRGRHDMVIADLRRLCVDRTNHLRHQTDLAESLGSQIDSACQFAERACDIGNPLDLLKTRAQVISRLHELVAMDVNTSVPFHPSDEALFSFAADHRQVLSEFEELLTRLGRIELSSPETALASKFTVDFPGGDRSSYPVKVPQKVRIRAKDPASASVESLSGNLHAFLQSPDGSSMECTNGEQRNDAFELELQPLVTGLHQLSISVSGVPVNGSPFPLNVVDGAEVIDVTWADAFAGCEHAVVVKFSGPTRLQPHIDSLRAWFFVLESPDATQGTEELEGARSEDGYELPRERTHSQEIEALVTPTEARGTFRIVYTPPVAGKLLMKILLDGEPIAKSPFVVIVSPLHPDSTIVSTCRMGKCPHNTAVLNMPYSVTLRTQDYLGKRLEVGGYNVTASVKTSSAPTRAKPCDVTDFQDGSYEISFTPRSLECHMVDIRVCGYTVKPRTSLRIAVQDSLPFSDPPGGYKRPTGMAVSTDGDTVYVADPSNDCKIFRLSADGRFMSEHVIDEAFRKRSVQIAANASGKLVLLIPHFKCVVTCDTNGKEEGGWNCADDNVKPANLAVSDEDHVIVGDSDSQKLFIYRANGETIGRIQLPEKSLAAGLNNVCVDRNGIIVVATHSSPGEILRFTTGGKAVSKCGSPADGTQLAVAATPEGAFVVSLPGRVLVLEIRDGDPVCFSVYRKIQTDHIYTKLAPAGTGCFVALDPGKKHMVKYCYTPQSTVV